MQKRGQNRPTLEDVARSAGVSTATVSRCLSQPDKVRPALRLGVEAAISALGYTPHGAARALASSRTNAIGAVIPTLSNAIFANVVQTLQRELSASGRTLLLAASDYDMAREAQQIRDLVVRGVDGLMLTGEARDPSVYQLLRRRRIPYVNTYVFHPRSENPSIGFDNRAAMAKLVAYLHDLGHRRIAMIAGLPGQNDRARERIEGTKAALEARGLEACGILERPYALDAGREALRQLLQQEAPPTAILGGNDVLALGALLEAKRLGLEVPRDLSIAGFDDLDIAREIPPGLTTIHAPLEDMGRQAAAYLLHPENGETPVHHVELPADLLVRGSTGPAPESPPRPLAADQR
ncbi:MAG: LacI family DNA-binding transcriptional regulator [Rhodospirillales bacterium]